MNILIIGNGFDLAHGLPTGYKDFLDCCKRIVLLFGPCANGKIGKDVLIDSNMNPLLKERIEYIYENGTVIVGTSPDHPYQTYTIDSTFDKPLNEMYECIKENIWYKLFIEKIDLNNTWIDFEKEISFAIQSLNQALTHHSKDIKNFAEVYCKIFSSKIPQEYNKASDYVKRLENDLIKLIRALEIYLVEFVEKIPTNKINFFTDLQIDYVLSFNYTHTFTKLYDRITRHNYKTGTDEMISCSFIHGQTSNKSNLEVNNMVLGIDEFLTNKPKDEDLLFISFKKYFQRIYKGTGSEYLDWIAALQSNYNSQPTDIQKIILENISKDVFRDRTSLGTRFSNVYIFGHSLDITDGDVLRKFILNDYVKTNIFYYREYEDDKRDLKQKITNLVKIIGQEELIRRTGGPTRTIEFIPQEIPKAAT